MAERERILVRAPNWIGDAVVSLGFLAALSKRDPGAELTVLANSRVADLFEGNPAVNGLMAFEAGESILAIAGRIRGRGFGRCYVLPLSFSSAAAAFLAGIPERIGYSAECRGPMLTRRLPYGRKAFRSRHLLLGFCRLLGEEVAPETPVYRPTAQESGEADSWLSAKGIGGEVAGFGPGATYGPAKRWPEGRWVELGQRLAGRGLKVLLFGSPGEAELCRRIAGGIGRNAASCAGEADLRRSAALVSRCGLFVTNDTGIMHLAAAAGTRVVALFGSTNPGWTRPWGEGHGVVSAGETCSPCYRRTCPHGHYRCLEGITVDAVLEAIDKRAEIR